MPLPPVVAELRANISDYMAKMSEARASWGATASAIGDPAPMVAAQKSLAGIASRTAETTEQTKVLAETTRETYGSMRSSAAAVIPGLNELSGVLGGVRNRFTEIGAASKAALAQATADTEALRVELLRANVALDANIKKTMEAAEGSRGQWLAGIQAQAAREKVEALNTSLVESEALQAKAGKGVGQAKFAAVGGGVAAAGVAIAGVVGYESVKAALAEQTQLALLRNAIAKTKETWKDYVPQLESVEGQMRHLGYADQDTAASAQFLTSALHDPEKALNLVGMAANVARARHIDLATATGYVAKITTGHVGTLGRLGLASKDAAGNTLTVKQSIDELGKAYGSAAQAYSSTLQGKFAEFKADSEHVFSAIGTKLIPILSDLMSDVAEAARAINTHVVPALKSLWDWFEAKIVPAIKHVVDIIVGAYHSAFDSITKAAHGHGEELQRLVGAFKALAEFIATKVLPIIAYLAKIFIEVGGKAIGVVITILAKLVDALGYVVSAAGDAASGILNYFVKPVVDGMLNMAKGVLKALDMAFGHLPFGLGTSAFRDAASAVDSFATSVNNGLTSAADATSKWGDTHAQIAKTAKDATQALTQPNFNIDSGYSAGLKNVAEKTKAHHESMKKLHNTAAEEAKKRAEAAKKALAEQAARLKAQAASALAAAKAIAEREAAQLRAALAAAQEAARQLDVANKLAGGGGGNLSLIDGQMFNRGSSFAQLQADQARGATINLNIAGRVTTERDLIAALHEGLLTYGRTNISTGLA